MDPYALAEEIGTRLKTIDGLTVHIGPPGLIHDPCAVVVLPDEIEYDRTYGRGADRIAWPVLVVVSKVDDASVVQRTAEYSRGTGAKSVKAVLEDSDYQWQQCHSMFVAKATFDTVTWGTADYVGVLFELHIIGSGS